MRAIAFGLIFVGAFLPLVYLVATLVCIIGGW